jgi:hypothetical protein
MKTKLLGDKIRDKIEFFGVNKRRKGWEEKSSYISICVLQHQL